ncbi:MAG: transcription antitermination factor NusB [Chitinivibrionia bacterium]|nr:transcription antitermination factor NusB [Chitinivibrionia bacterium]
MGKRRKAREIVLQVLYELEFSDREWTEVLRDQTELRYSTEETMDYARELLAATLGSKADLDARIESMLQNWDMGRLSLIDKNILRFACAEILFFPGIPGKVIINEALEIANKYSSMDAGRLINGLLDRFAKEIRTAEM